MLKAILFNDTSHNKHHGCQIVVKQIYALASAAGINIIKACPMRHDWRDDFNLQNDIASADLCLINGEGTLHDDARAAQVLVALAPFCKARGIPCFLINSVWQRNDKLIGPARSFSGIYLRDHRSQDELAAVGIVSRVVPDLTLSMVPPSASAAMRQGFLVNGSFYEERTQEAWAAVQAAADPAVTYQSIQALPKIQLGKGFARYVWVSLRSRFKAWRARRHARRTTLGATIERKQIKVLRWKYCAISDSELLTRLASSEGVITGRFHCATLCLLTNTPFFAIGSNTHKIEALLEACQLKGRIYSDYASALTARSRIAFDDAERLAIGKFVRDSRGMAEQMFVDIAAQVVAGARSQVRPH